MWCFDFCYIHAHESIAKIGICEMLTFNLKGNVKPRTCMKMGVRENTSISLKSDFNVEECSVLRTLLLLQYSHLSRSKLYCNEYTPNPVVSKSKKTAAVLS